MKIILITIALLLSPAVFAKEKVSDAEKVFNEGVKHYDSGAFTAAEKSFRKALKKDSHLERARFQLAATLLMTERMDEALKELNGIHSDEKVLALVPLMKGDIFLRQSKWPEALTAWENAPNKNPDQKSIRSQGLARAYEGLNKPKEAADAWNEHLNLQVKPANETFERVAVNRIKAGEKDQALSFCEKADFLQKQEAYKDICRAHVYHAEFTVKSDKRAGEKAVSALEDALKKDKNNFDAQSLLAEWKK
jgi:tetratricopeptide (TPR) repeat protein